MAKRMTSVELLAIYKAAPREIGDEGTLVEANAELAFARYLLALWTERRAALVKKAEKGARVFCTNTLVPERACDCGFDRDRDGVCTNAYCRAGNLDLPEVDMDGAPFGQRWEGPSK